MVTGSWPNILRATVGRTMGQILKVEHQVYGLLEDPVQEWNAATRGMQSVVATGLVG